MSWKSHYYFKNFGYFYWLIKDLTKILQKSDIVHMYQQQLMQQISIQFWLFMFFSPSTMQK